LDPNSGAVESDCPLPAIVSRRNLENPVIQGTNLVPATLDRVGDGLGIPTSGQPRRKQSFHFRREIERLLVKGVEQRLNPKPVTRGKHHPIRFIPNHKSKLAPQSMQALSANILWCSAISLSDRVRRR